MKKLWQRTYQTLRPGARHGGQGLVEYAILLAFIALVVYVIVQLLEPSIGDVFSRFVTQAPVAPPSLVNYTPPPSVTPTATHDPLATATFVPTVTPVPSETPVPSDTPPPTDTPTATATPPCTAGGPFAVPGLVQMEDFRCGGLGVAFNDSPSVGPGSGVYRADVGIEGPDLTASTDGGGYQMGWVNSSDWVAYDVVAPAAFAYGLRLRYAAPDGIAPAMRIVVTQGGLTAGPFNWSAPSTGAWDNWADAEVQISLFDGDNTIRFTSTSPGTNANFNYFQIVNFSATPTPTAAPTNTPIPTPTPTIQVTTVAFPSDTSYDGNVDNNGDLSNTTIRLGDTTGNSTQRGFVSFDSSSLPANAVIVTARLRVFVNQIQGDPFNDLGDVFIDIAGPTGFSGNYALQASDYGAAAAALQVASFGNTADDTWADVFLNTAGLNNINRSGQTQFRLRFETLTNNDNGRDRIRINPQGGGNRPTLIIGYTVP